MCLFWDFARENTRHAKLQYILVVSKSQRSLIKV